MEEKVLIKSERYKAIIVLILMIIVGVILSAVVVNMFVADKGEHIRYDNRYDAYVSHRNRGYCLNAQLDAIRGVCETCEIFLNNTSKMEYVLTETFEGEPPFYIIPVAAFTLVGILLYLWLRSYELTVTDKRIYGKIVWGKRVDLPIDSVSAIACNGLFKGITVATSSGKISFLFIKNAKEIYDIINILLIKRQKEKANAPAVVTVPQNDEADQIKKYKDLLDNGAITQEEYDAKKKQLLGL